MTAIYEELIEQVKRISEIRSDPSLKHEHNRVDIVLDDAFQLLSLTFMTVGLNRAVPATFASLSTVHKLLLHLKESKVYSDNDTIPIRKRLDEIKGIISADDDPDLLDVIHLIRHKLDICEKTLDEVQKSMKTVDEGLKPMLRKLVTIKREIMSIGSKPQFTPTQFDPVIELLTKIESQRVDGNFVSDDGNIDPEGQGVLNGLLEECHTLLHDFSASSDPSKNFIPEGLKPTYNELVNMKIKLEGLLVTHRWTLRETDLYTYQKNLQTIEEFRSSSAFSDIAKNATKAKSIILYLLRRCYAILYKLLESSEPVSEALISIHNQLSTVRRCLLDVQRMGGISSARELYPYQMKLASIDDLRVDGKFMVDGTIPEGQGMLNALLAECFDICHEMRVQIEESS